MDSTVDSKNIIIFTFEKNCEKLDVSPRRF